MTLDAAAVPAIPRPGNAPELPAARGPLTAQLFAALSCSPRPFGPLAPLPSDALADDDLQLALYCCYELHYRSFVGVSDDWEWDPSLLAFRSVLEGAFERCLLSETGPFPFPDDVEEVLVELANASAGPSLSSYLSERGTLAELRELAVHRSAYQLKEADPHTWAIPRLHGGPKAALVEIQLDEYGGGRLADMHATLFERTMDALGLDTGYGAYLDSLPAATLATTNLVSMFGLHRRWRGALAGHLALFEATSVGPMARYAAAMRRLGVAPGAERFYDVHVEADLHHEVVGCRALAGGLAAQQPELAGDIVFGARALVLVEARFTRHVLGAWKLGRSSLRRPVPAAVLPA